MGLFSTFSKKPSGSSGASSHVSQYGSAHGEISQREYRAGIHREIDHAFHGSEREAIKVMLEQQFDNSRGNIRHVLDAHEAKEIVDDVHRAFSREHADKLQAILDKRLQ